jgi:hypothetical protein
MASRLARRHVAASVLLERSGARRKVGAGLVAGARVLVDAWKEELSQPGQGRLYPAGIRFLTIGGRTFATMDPARGRPNDHVASAPGQPPAPDTGALRDSIGMEIDGGAVVEDSRISGFRDVASGRFFAEREISNVRVGSSSEVMVYMEHGVFNHPGGITIEPRPSAGPALERARLAMSQAFVAAVRGE